MLWYFDNHRDSFSLLIDNEDTVIVNSITKSMELSTSWEANSYKASQEISSLMELKVSLSCSQDLATGLYPEPD
jgi:hypothetical protein